MTRELPIFVYGTLRPGEGNYSNFLRGKTLTETHATLTGAVMHDSGGFPFVAPTEDPTAIVHGDLITVPGDLYPEVLNALDRLEGYFGPHSPSNMYDRVEVTVTTPDGPVLAYTYLCAPTLYHRRVQHMPRIDSGDWIKHDEARTTTSAW